MSGEFGPPLPDDGTDPKVSRAYALERLTKAYIARFGERRFNDICDRAMAEVMASDPCPAPVEDLGNGLTRRTVNISLLFDAVEKIMQEELASPESTDNKFRWPWARLVGRWSQRT